MKLLSSQFQIFVCATANLYVIANVRVCFVVFQEKQRFLTDVLHEVMLLDGLASSHPVSQEVQQATDIDRVFDWIAYKKVGAEQKSCLLDFFWGGYLSSHILLFP